MEQENDIYELSNDESPNNEDDSHKSQHKMFLQYDRGEIINNTYIDNTKPFSSGSFGQICYGIFLLYNDF